MQVVFIKNENRAYSVVVTRNDGVKIQFLGVGKKFLIPHDLSHFIVESILDMRQGFWGCVSYGALFLSMNIIEGRQKAHAKSRSKQIIKEAERQLRLAECLVRVFEEITVAQLDRVPTIAQKHLSQISSDIKPQIFDAKIADVCSNLRTYRIKWQEIEVGENIELLWNQKFPVKSLLG